MKKRYITFCLSIGLFLNANAQCLFKKTVTNTTKTATAYTFRQEVVYNKNFEVKIQFEKVIIEKSVSYNIIIFSIGSIYKIQLSDLLQLTFENGETIDIYLPEKNGEPNIKGESAYISVYGSLESNDPNIEKLKKFNITKAILLDDKNNYVSLNLPKNYFINLFNCAADKN